MRRIVIDRETLDRARGLGASRVVVPVVVGWPELALTDDQHLANALAAIEGRPAPFEGPYIAVELEL